MHRLSTGTLCPHWRQGMVFMGRGPPWEVLSPSLQLFRPLPGLIFRSFGTFFKRFPLLEGSGAFFGLLRDFDSFSFTLCTGGYSVVLYQPDRKGGVDPAALRP